MSTPLTAERAAYAVPRVPGEPGIWAFVGGDLIVFSVFFVLIALGQSQQPEVFTASRARLDLWIGMVNTFLLLTGSLFAARGVERCREAHGDGDSRFFAWAILCGLGFVANKIFEWSRKLADGLGPTTNDFFNYFFIFTGIHLLHVLVGLGVLGLLYKVSRRASLTRGNVRTLEIGAIFWHLVDLLWIVLFALFYLL